MPKNDIGGFFVSLGLNADKQSFETGNKLVDTVANSFNKLIGAARNAAVVLAGTAIASGAVESAAYKSAEKIGISTETLDLWKASAKIAGVNANSLVGAMGKLSDVMGRMRIDGAGLEQFTKKLGELGLVVDDIDIAKMLNMAPDELMTEIIRKAQEASAKAKKDIAEANKALANNPKDTAAQENLKNAQKEQRRISIIVGDILGEAGQDFYIELQRQGKTIDEFLTGAGRTVFTTAEDNQKGANFATEVNTLRAELESMGKLVGDSVGGILTPYLKKVNDWIQAHGDEIADKIRAIADGVGKLVEKIVGIIQNEKVQDAGNAVVTTMTAAKNTFSFVTADTEEEKQEAAEKANAAIEELKGFKDKGGAAGLLGAYATFVSDITDDAIGLIANIKQNRAEKKQRDVSEKALKGYFNRVNKDKVSKNEKLRIGDEISTSEAQRYRDELGDKVAGKYIQLQDGIMRPNGTVAQVAPDDWVFAVRNVGDLARAFIPQTLPQASAAAPSSYTINQTFNISGSNDIPQVIREQAYRGTQNGLLQLMAQSSQRLQLMSGTR